MESDIVERLRNYEREVWKDHLDAADEIERLREALKPFAEEATHWSNHFQIMKEM